MLTFLSLLFFAGLLSLLKMDGELTTASQMRAQLWLATADILGTVFGILLAIVTVAFVITQYESRLPEPRTVEAMNQDEKEMVQKILKDNLGGGQE